MDRVAGSLKFYWRVYTEIPAGHFFGSPASKVTGWLR